MTVIPCWPGWSRGFLAGCLRRTLGHLLEANALLEKQADRTSAFLSALALSGLDARHLSDLTVDAYSRSRPRTALFEWEHRWFETELPAPPARLMVGGAGKGLEVEALAARGYRVVAFDPVRAWANTAAKELVPTRCEAFLEGCYEDIAHPDGRAERVLAHELRQRSPYDAILLGWGSFTHVVEEIDRVAILKQLLSMCPRGPLLLSFWSRDDTPTMPERRMSRWGRRLGEALSAGIPRIRRPGDEVWPGCGFGHAFTESEIRNLAQNTGYAVKSISTDRAGSVYPHATLIPVCCKSPAGSTAPSSNIL